MARKNIQDQFHLDLFNAKVICKSGHFYLNERSLSKKQYLGRNQLNFAIPRVKLLESDKIKIMKNHMAILSEIQSTRFANLFVQITEDESKVIWKLFRDTWKDGVLQLFFDRTTLSEVMCEFEKITSTPSPILKPEFTHTIEQLQKKWLYEELETSHFSKMPLHPSPIAKAVMIELINTGTVTHDDERRTPKSIYAEYRALMETHTNSQKLKTKAKGIIDQFAQKWRAMKSFHSFTKSLSITTYSEVNGRITRDWLKSLDAFNSSRTVSDYLRCNKKAFALCKALGLLQGDCPFAGLTAKETSYDRAKSATEPINKAKMIPPDELVHFLHELHELTKMPGNGHKKALIRNYHQVLLMLNLGVRGIELQETSFNQFDAGVSAMINGEKRRASKRVFGLVSPTVSRLNEVYKGKLPGDSRQLTQFLDRHYHNGNLSYKITAHQFRHTFISYEMFVHREDPNYKYILMRITGHTSEEIQDIYNDFIVLHSGRYSYELIVGVWEWIKNDILEFPTKNFDRRNGAYNV